MTDTKPGTRPSEFAEIFRWIIVIPVFAVLVLLAANFTIGFFKWLGEQDGWLYYAMFPVGLIIVLSNALTSILACMIAPRKVSAVILLGIGYLVVVAVNYSRYDWASEGVFYSHAVMVYVGLFIVYYLDRLNSKEGEASADPVSS
ncbi:MAG TPA: hypothetical protein VGA18_04800 [Rhodothermales bacterium]